MDPVRDFLMKDYAPRQETYRVRGALNICGLKMQECRAMYKAAHGQPTGKDTSSVKAMYKAAHGQPTGKDTSSVKEFMGKLHARYFDDATGFCKMKAEADELVASSTKTGKEVGMGCIERLREAEAYHEKIIELHGEGAGHCLFIVLPLPFCQRLTPLLAVLQGLHRHCGCRVRTQAVQGTAQLTRWAQATAHWWDSWTRARILICMHRGAVAGLWPRLRARWAWWTARS